MMMESRSRDEALGQSEVFLDFQDQLSRVAPVNRPVLLLGERGTGKELAARRLHFLSERWDGPFITLNCATLSPTLIESELFGHERGAYTGAETLRIGRFEAAHGGSLFLDEIGTIPVQAQEKILRVVEYHFFERVGGSEQIDVDVRIICATNADLPEMARQGTFKRDLLDRLSFEVLFLPPLRHRGEDIMVLAEHFGSRMLFELGIEESISFSPAAVTALERYRWHGNIRELKNVVERAVYRAAGGSIEDIDFDPFDSPYFPNVTEHKGTAGTDAGSDGVRPPTEVDLSAGFKDLVKTYEARLVQQALEASQFNQKKSAALLGLTYDQFRGLMRKHRSVVDR